MLKQTDMQNHKYHQLDIDKLANMDNELELDKLLVDTDSKQLADMDNKLVDEHMETLSIQCTTATISNKQLEDIKRQDDTDSSLFKQLEDMDNKIMASKHQSINSIMAKILMQHSRHPRKALLTNQMFSLMHC